MREVFVIVLLHGRAQRPSLRDHHLAVLLQALAEQGQIVFGDGAVPLLMLGYVLALIFLADRALEHSVVGWRTFSIPIFSQYERRLSHA